MTNLLQPPGSGCRPSGIERDADAPGPADPQRQTVPLDDRDVRPKLLLQPELQLLRIERDRCVHLVHDVSHHRHRTVSLGSQTSLWTPSISAVTKPTQTAGTDRPILLSIGDAWLLPLSCVAAICVIQSRHENPYRQIARHTRG
jgi:hypothetical protein